MQTSVQPPVQKIPGAWWIAPILFGLLGGLIAWGVNKSKNPPVAKQMLITGAAISGVYILITIASASA